MEVDLILTQIKPVMLRSVEVNGMLFMLISFTCGPEAISCQNIELSNYQTNFPDCDFPRFNIFCFFKPCMPW